jgi:hypothetical protein
MSHLKYILGSLMIFSALLILCNLSNPVQAVDAHLDQDGWEWHYDTGAPDNLTSIVKTGSSTEVDIPTTLDGVTPLEHIADFGAGGGALTKVLSMPSTVKTVDGDLIQFGSITSFVFGSGVSYIGSYCLSYDSSLSSVTFLSLVAPWSSSITLSSPNAVGHAYTGSSFPAPGSAYFGLTMGTYIYMITSGSAATTGVEDSPYYYNATANQAGYWTVISPSWLSINSTGHATGTPTDANVGAVNASIRFNNSNGWSYKNWTLTVGNIAPTITTTPVTVDTMAGIYRYDANASEAVTWTITCSDPDIDIDANGVVSGYLSDDSARTVSIRATDASGGVVWQNYTITVHGPMTDLAPVMVAIIPVIALVVIVSVGISSIKRKR